MLSSVLKNMFRPAKAENSRLATTSEASAIVRFRQEAGGTIICFSTDSHGGALGELIRHLLEPFRNLAKDIVVIDFDQPDWLPRLRAALVEPVWFAASYFGAGQHFSAGERQDANAWAAAGIPFVRFFGDTPAYFPDRHIAGFRNSINAYFDVSHAKFYRRWHSNPALSVVLPPIMTDAMPLADVNVEAKLFGKIIFPKNGGSPQQLLDYWRKALPSQLAAALEALAEESIGREWIDREPQFDDRLIAYFAGRGVEIAAEPAVLCFLVAQLDDYVRRVKATLIAEALLDLPVIIRGRAWQHIDFSGKRATYDPNFDVASTQALIDQAPALVDMSPNIQHAPHDRVWRAVGRGTAFLTNRQHYCEKTLPNAGQCTFPFQPDAIRSLVEHYATHPREAVELGIEQSRIMRAAFDPQVYMDSLLTAVQVISFRLGGRPAGTQDFVEFPPAHYR